MLQKGNSMVFFVDIGTVIEQFSERFQVFHLDSTVRRRQVIHSFITASRNINQDIREFRRELAGDLAARHAYWVF
jgi:hypothetical protein